MMRYVLRRLAAAIPTLLIIITASFFLMRLAPGGPFDRSQRLPADVSAHLEQAYGLDQPLPVQYLRYLEGLAHGDFGPSFRYHDFTVTGLIAQGLPVTLELGTLALLLALGLGIPAGLLAALRRETLADRGVMTLVALGIAVPSFVLLPALMLLFGVKLRWLPVAGYEPGASRTLVLPVVALALPPLAYVARLTRSGLLDALDSPYVRMARAKGLRLRRIVLAHALKPALVPVAGFLAPAVAAVMTGSLVVETIAGMPGIGRYLVQGALNRDYTLVMGMVILYSTVLILTGLVVDVLYTWLDPRVRPTG
jgi:oligopeptide transport system permease protein